AKKLIKADPTSDISKILAKLVLSLESDVSFQVKELYDLDYEDTNTDQVNPQGNVFGLGSAYATYSN
ncbi:MAG: hypothetical protein ACKVOY_09160, partial [Burkholderiaceae bacterium]